MEDNKLALRNQITDAAGSIQYTFIAHWNIVNRLKQQYKTIKIIQIVLTALSTGGFLASILSGISQLSWVGGLTSAIALGLNLYMLNFNLPEKIKQHTGAANELWEVREKYKSLITDFESVDVTEVRSRRDSLIMAVSRINKEYPGTDEKSFSNAQTDICKYEFSEGEAAKIFHTEDAMKNK